MRSARRCRFISCLAYAFEPSMRAAALLGPKAGDAGARELVDEAGHERRLGPDHDQIDLALARERDEVVVGQALDAVAGDARVAGRAQQLRLARAAQQRADQRVLAPAAADHEEPGASGRSAGCEAIPTRAPR